MAKAKSKTATSSLIAHLRDGYKDDAAMAKHRLKNLASPTVKARISLVSVVLNQCEKLGAVNQYLTVYYSGSVDAEVYIKTDSLKSAKVEQLLSWMEDNLIPARSSTDHASEYSASRSFNYEMEGLNIRMVFDLPTDGDACRRVKTGTKMVEQPTYEIRCA